MLGGTYIFLHLVIDMSLFFLPQKINFRPSNWKKNSPAAAPPDPKFSLKREDLLIWEVFAITDIRYYF